MARRGSARGGGAIRRHPRSEGDQERSPGARDERPSPSQIDVIQTAREYHRLAGFYDLLAVPWLTNGVRREAVARLRLHPGDCVMDLGCGTGLTLPMLARAVGPTGRVVAVDLSPDQLARASERVRKAGWRNVSLVEANAEELALGEEFDGIVSSYTHDIMTSALAVERALSHLKPGARFVALGFCRPTGWRAPLNAGFTAFYRLFNVPVNWDAETSNRPWTYLEQQVGPAKVKRRFLGVWYRAVAVKPQAEKA